MLTDDQKIYKNDSGPAICCFVHSIIQSYYKRVNNEKFLCRNRPGICSDLLFSNLDGICFLFRVHLRKLCYLWTNPDDRHSHPGMLLPNKQLKKPIDIDSCKEELINDNDDDDSTDEYPGFYIYDMDDPVDKLRQTEIDEENSAYTLTAGTLITFRENNVFCTDQTITCRIETIKEDCDTTTYPLTIKGGQVLVDKTMYLRVEGKNHPFCFRSVTLKPGTILSPRKKNTKPKTIDEHFQHFNALQDKEVEGEDSSNSKRPFEVPKETKITYREMKEYNLRMGCKTVMDDYSFPTNKLDDVVNDSTAPLISIFVIMNDVQRILNKHQPNSNTEEDKYAFDEDRKATTMIIDIDSFWRFQNTQQQHQMISLPADIHNYFVGIKNKSTDLCFEWLQKRLPDCDRIFDYSCIDITIHASDHWSRVFVLNASKALDNTPPDNNKDTTNSKTVVPIDMDHIPSIVLCNSMSSISGDHSIPMVTQFVIQFLNYLRKHLLYNNKIQSNEQQSRFFLSKRFTVKRLEINQQHDGWSCGFHSILARQKFLQLLLDGCKFNKEFFKNQKKLIVIDAMKAGKVDEIRSTLFQILTFMNNKKTKRIQKQQQTSNDLVVNLDQD